MHRISLRQRAIPTLLALSATAALAEAQLTERAPQRLLDALELEGGTVQRLVLPWTEWQPFETTVEINGVRRRLVVEPYDMRGPDYRIVSFGAAGVEEFDAPIPTTYRGVVEGVPGSVAAVNLFEGQLSGIVLLGEEVWAVQPATEGFGWLPRTAHVVYRQDQIKQLALSCGTKSVAKPSGGVVGFPDMPQNVELAAELHPRFRNIWGGIAGSVNQATAILNGVDAIYERDTNLSYTITRLVTREGGYSSNNTNVLNQMTNTWVNRAGEIDRDLAHLFTGNASSGVIGVAFLSSICNQNSHYSVSWNTSSLITRTAVTAHEFGHSWSAGHCDGAGQCFIMCSFIGGCNGVLTAFAPISINRISNFAATRNCLN